MFKIKNYFYIIASVFIVQINVMASEPTVATEMPSATYLVSFKKTLTESFCSPEGMLACFTVSAQQCQTTMDTVFDSCKKKIKVPKIVNLFLAENQIDEKFGSCAGARFAQIHSAQFKKGSSCKHGI